GKVVVELPTGVVVAEISACEEPSAEINASGLEVSTDCSSGAGSVTVNSDGFDSVALISSAYASLQ
ncbi:MAG: hypothetical protein WD033_06780, partial [Nitrosopumilaceae archaeon]